jgi:hypothetical protein
MLRRTGLVTDLVVQARGTRPRGLRAPTAASEKRCRNCFGVPGFLGRAPTCRWAGSLAIASHEGREVLRSRRGCWRGDFVSGGAEAQLRPPTFSLVKGTGLGGPAAEFSPRCGENWGSAQEGSAVAEIPVTWPLLARGGPRVFERSDGLRASAAGRPPRRRNGQAARAPDSP